MAVKAGYQANKLNGLKEKINISFFGGCVIGNIYILFAAVL